MIKNYYFTYSNNENFPYKAGWTKIEAPTLAIAIAIFRHYHPDRVPGLINCSWYYTEEEFRETCMWREGNYGAHEVEVILMQRFVPFNAPWE